jgi:hypothetical protein
MYTLEVTFCQLNLLHPDKASASRPMPEPARNKPYDPQGVLCSCGRPVGAVLGCDAPRHIPSTGHQFTAEAVPHPLSGALRARRDHVRRPAGTVSPASDQLGRRALPGPSGGSRLRSKRREIAGTTRRASRGSSALIPTAKPTTSGNSRSRSRDSEYGRCPHSSPRRGGRPRRKAR